MGGRYKEEGRRTKCERLHDEKIANTSTIAMPSVPSPVQYSTVQYSTLFLRVKVQAGDVPSSDVDHLLDGWIVHELHESP